MAPNKIFLIIRIFWFSFILIITVPSPTLAEVAESPANAIELALMAEAMPLFCKESAN